MSLLSQLKTDEGFELKPYKDTQGKLTIGYGHNLTDNGISLNIAEQLLQDDINTVTKDLTFKFPWVDKLDEVRRNVLINMCFNMGINTLSTFTDFLTLVNQGKYEAASEDMLETLWAHQVGGRARRLSVQLRTGIER